MNETASTYDARARETLAMARDAHTVELRDLLNQLAATYERIAVGYTQIARQTAARELNEAAKTHRNQAGWPAPD